MGRPRSEGKGRLLGKSEGAAAPLPCVFVPGLLGPGWCLLAGGGRAPRRSRVTSLPPPFALAPPPPHSPAPNLSLLRARPTAPLCPLAAVCGVGALRMRPASRPWPLGRLHRPVLRAPGEQLASTGRWAAPSPQRRPAWPARGGPLQSASAAAPAHGCPALPRSHLPARIRRCWPKGGARCLARWTVSPPCSATLWRTRAGAASSCTPHGGRGFTRRPCSRQHPCGCWCAQWQWPPAANPPGTKTLGCSRLRRARRPTTKIPTRDRCAPMAARPVGAVDVPPSSQFGLQSASFNSESCDSCCCVRTNSRPPRRFQRTQGTTRSKLRQERALQTAAVRVRRTCLLAAAGRSSACA